VLTQNVGECPARNKGVDAANGKWIVWLDSDHELLPNALQRLSLATANAPEEIGRVGFMCQFDDGRVSPFPPPTGKVLTYRDHVRWFERSCTSDLVMATRRSTYAVCRMPESRVAPTLYHLDFARLYKEQWIPEILVLQRTNSPNRLTEGYRGTESVKRRRRAEDDLGNIEEIMRKHGQTLRECAPIVTEGLGRDCASAHVVAGPWVAGVAAAFQHVKRYPRSPLSWAMLGLAACGPSVLLSVKRWRHKRVDAVIQRECKRFAAGTAFDACSGCGLETPMITAQTTE
jgi:glycosyltransferase involved in cell wall biosynthesis